MGVFGCGVVGVRVCVAASGVDWRDFTTRLQTGCFQVKATGNAKRGILSLVLSGPTLKRSETLEKHL